MVRLRSAEDLHHAGQQPVNAGAHVDGVHRQPDGVDPDHRSSSRIHAAHCEAAVHGQLTLIAIGPRRSSMRMSVGTAWAGGNCTGTKAVGTALFAASTNAHATAPLGLSDPAAGQVRVEAMGHRHCGARHARRAAGRDDLRLELGAMFAPASTPSVDFVGDSVHVSTKSFVDTSILKRICRNQGAAARRLPLTAMPASACLRKPTICSSLNLLFFMSVPSSENGLY